MSRVAIVAALAVLALVLVGAVALAASRGAVGAPSTDRQTVRAPIESVEVVIRESNPPQVSVNVKAGLPSGCAQKDSYSVQRSGDTFTITVLNSMPKGDPICTMIYGTYDLRIDLQDIRLGGSYTVHVNDKTTTFKT